MPATEIGTSAIFENGLLECAARNEIAPPHWLAPPGRTHLPADIVSVGNLRLDHYLAGNAGF